MYFTLKTLQFSILYDGLSVLYIKYFVSTMFNALYTKKLQNKELKIKRLEN